MSPIVNLPRPSVTTSVEMCGCRCVWSAPLVAFGASSVTMIETSPTRDLLHPAADTRHRLELGRMRVRAADHSCVVSHRRPLRVRCGDRRLAAHTQCQVRHANAAVIALGATTYAAGLSPRYPSSIAYGLVSRVRTSGSKFFEGDPCATYLTPAALTCRRRSAPRSASDVASPEPRSTSVRVHSQNVAPTSCAPARHAPSNFTHARTGRTFEHP